MKVKMNPVAVATAVALAGSLTATSAGAVAIADGDYTWEVLLSPEAFAPGSGIPDVGTAGVDAHTSFTFNATPASGTSQGNVADNTTLVGGVGSGIDDGLAGVGAITVSGGNITFTDWNFDTTPNTAGGNFAQEGGVVADWTGTTNDTTTTFNPVGRIGNVDQLAAGGAKPWNYAAFTTGPVTVTGPAGTASWEGVPVANVGDVNGDGLDDYTVTFAAAGLVGAEWPGFAGAAYIEVHEVRINSVAGGGGSAINAAVLPSSRSVEVGTPATAFATIINAGTTDATGCGITPSATPVIPATFLYQTTDASNNLTGTADTPADIAAGAQQNYLIAVTPSGAFDPTDLAFEFDCTDTDPAAVVSGLNTLLISASATPIADIVALSATINNDGYTDIPGDTGTGVFAVAAVNVGSTDTITASSVLSDAALPVTVTLCETDATGNCLAAPTPTVTTSIDADATPSFAAFVTGSGNVADDPAANRITVQFEDSAAVVRGATSVAVRTITAVPAGTP